MQQILKDFINQQNNYKNSLSIFAFHYNGKYISGRDINNYQELFDKQILFRTLSGDYVHHYDIID